MRELNLLCLNKLFFRNELVLGVLSLQVVILILLMLFFFLFFIEKQDDIIVCLVVVSLKMCRAMLFSVRRGRDQTLVKNIADILVAVEEVRGRHVFISEFLLLLSLLPFFFKHQKAGVVLTFSIVV